ncbi:FAD-dependent monooxygenase [Mucilaginibacter sp. HC2]|uniref:FAD-dependent oxidoreductase n=1 Tax=Mucilaginibacter inviolabilis TaxID=2714892 RepID=UPI00140870C1|nr:NAD(P)/FAD-dependent oxidoreductase [Mucilaginibacter inviolabilis]NHA02573.1 FAD-dependent monooxygenase [Mucilaginibacter inviolabilis]
MIIENKQVAIIGGGPGGLTLARMLQLKGVGVKVYERDFDETARVQGATLDLHYESGLKAIKAAGLTEAFKAAYRPGADKGRVVDQQGEILYDEAGTEGNDDMDSIYARPEIDRGPLRDILLASLEPDTIVWDAQFSNMAQKGEGWELTFKNGTKAYADLVIGADGSNSRIRPFVTDLKNSYAGTVIIQGNVRHYPEIEEMLNGGKIYIFADEKYFHISAKGDGSIDFYISLKKEENWVQHIDIDFTDLQQVVSWAEQEFRGWSHLFIGLIAHTSSPLLLRPQYCMPFDQSWHAHPNVTLLGDAAHLMPPSGEGVNLAMLDALELSECLTADILVNLESSISLYENKMQSRAIAEAEISLDMVRWMHDTNASQTMIKLLNHGQ